MAKIAAGGLRSLGENELIDRIRLIRSPNVGPVTFHKLIMRFGDAGAALDALPDLARRGGLARPFRIAGRHVAEREVETADRAGCRLIASCEPDYPSALRTIDSAPPIITIKGNASLFARPSAAIVGSRNASIAGCKIAGMLARGIGEAGFSVTSGLARGIDAAAHEASVPTGTIAVLAGGLDRPYPPQNIPLMNRIAETGVVLSETPFGHEPRARDFPRRNRIIAGISLGLVVVEAAKRSGSLISARLAGDYGRLVFAVPGSPLDPRAKGTNDLIRDGAILAAEPGHIVSAIDPLVAVPEEFDFQSDDQLGEPAAAPPPADADRERIAGLMGPTPIAIDDIIRHVDVAASQVQMVLLELDLAGRIERHAGGMVSLATPYSSD
ncbi:MAG: DNA processing protein DprA [Rhizobiaceae bacterium MnEN-MB40S]|nr:MAG: DNA processing protein DprA [Rhizobiaceae bacterium MnEN-MB40S]